MKSSHPTEITSGTPCVSPIANPKILPFTYPMLDPSLIKSKDPTYFLIDHPSHTPTSLHIRNISILPIIQPSMDPSNIPASVLSFDPSHIMSLIK